MSDMSLARTVSGISYVEGLICDDSGTPGRSVCNATGDTIPRSLRSDGGTSGLAAAVVPAKGS